MSSADQFWWLGPTLGLVTIGFVVWFNYGQRKLREWRMRKPFDMYFVTEPDRSKDDFRHEMHVPAYSDVEVQLRMAPLMHFRQELFLFGFRGYTQHPRPLKVVNTYIKQGKRREQSPDDTEGHYIDKKDRYHIRESVERTKSNHYAYGFLVRTFAPGRYPVVIETITDCGEGKPKKELVLVVDPKPERKSPKPLKRQPRRSSAKTAS